MDLRNRLETAGSGLLAILDPEREFFPTGGYEIAHDLGRFWDAAFRLEETIDFEIPAELEAASLANLARLTDNPDRLLLNRLDIPATADKAKINPHNFRETLLAFGGLISRRHNRWARAASLELVASMRRILREDGSLDYTRLGSWGRLPPTEDPSHTEAKRDAWFDGTASSGRALEALVWLYESTHESSVLELAERIAEHHLEFTTNPDGSMREEIVAPENVGHNHSYHGTLRGLLLFGLLTDQRTYVDTIDATYRIAVRNRLVHESGWAPHDLGKLRFPNEHGDPVGEPASTGDSTQIALWLALRAGRDDLLDDVERLVRARLVPMQLTRIDVDRNPDRRFAPREIGAWGVHGPAHGGKGCTPDVQAAVIHTLCDVQRHVVTRRAAGVRVNLHFDTVDRGVEVTATRDDRARVRVVVDRPEELEIRVPGWAPAASVRVSMDGTPVAFRRRGFWCVIGADALRPRAVVELSFDLAERESEETMPSGTTYRIRWRGDEIVGISPEESTGIPFYPPNLSSP